MGNKADDPLIAVQFWSEELADYSKEAVLRPEDQATEMVKLGRAALEPSQTHPPIGVLDYILANLETLDFIGPPMGHPKTFSEVENCVLRYGIRQTHVSGDTIHWVPGLDELHLLVKRALSEVPEVGASVPDQLSNVLARRVL